MIDIAGTSAPLPSRSSGAYRAQSTNGPRADGPHSAAGSADTVTLSQHARLAQRVLDAAKASDGVDNNKVNILRDGVADGHYALSPDAIAHGVFSVAMEMDGVS